MKKFIKHV